MSPNKLQTFGLSGLLAALLLAVSMRVERSWPLHVSTLVMTMGAIGATCNGLGSAWQRQTPLQGAVFAWILWNGLAAITPAFARSGGVMLLGIGSGVFLTRPKQSELSPVQIWTGRMLMGIVLWEVLLGIARMVSLRG